MKVKLKLEHTNITC